MKISFKGTFVFYLIALGISTAVLFMNKNLMFFVIFANLLIIYLLFFRIDYGDFILNLQEQAKQRKKDLDNKKYYQQILDKGLFYYFCQTAHKVLIVFGLILMVVGFAWPYRLLLYQFQDTAHYYHAIGAFWWDFLTFQNKEDFFVVGKIAIFLQIGLHVLYLIFKESFLEAKRRTSKLNKEESAIFEHLPRLRIHLIIMVIFYFVGITLFFK
ncbi:MAG: hypothetical protein ABII88_09735 [Candidatus Omnitrophota bacterium]